MANDRESLTAVILHLETTRQNLIDLLAKEVGSEKAKQMTKEALETVDAELSRLSGDSAGESIL